MTLQVTAVITSFNRCATTVACLESLRAQQLPDGIALNAVLVDDGTDGTAEVATQAFPGLTAIRGTGTLYWVGGTALASVTAANAGADMLLWLNDDVVLHSDALAELVSVASGVPGGAIVSGPVCDPTTGAFTYGGRLRVPGIHRTRFEPAVPNGIAREVDAFNGNVVLVPRTAWEVLGHVDTTFSHNMADFDYALRAKQQGIPVMTTRAFIGFCEANRSKTKWAESTTPLGERWRLVRSTKAMPPKEWMTFCRRHGGRLWPLLFASPYVRAVTCSLSFAKGHGDRRDRRKSVNG